MMFKMSAKSQKKGKVYIIGTGPMNASLLTQQAKDCISEADIIFYDRLIDDSILKFRRQGVPVFFVGKSREKTFSQKEINRILVRRASQGLIVARLKGGDPFLFGRGAEEAFSLHEEGIDFEIINGVSSSFAVPAFAGIPLTLRRVSSAVTIVTGQEDPFKSCTSVDWSKVWSPEHTLVILMGMKNLPAIIRKLKAEGVPSKTPAAVIQEGATVRQKTVQATLSSLEAKVRAAGLKAPAVIVIGEVVRARKYLARRKKNKLLLPGKNVLMAATRESYYLFKDIIEPAGCRLRHFEGVSISPAASFAKIDKEIEQLSSYQWLVFTSKNSVHIFIRRMRELGKDLRCLSGVKIAVIGPGTAQVLRSYFLEPDLMPCDFSSQGLAEAFSGSAGPRGKVLLPRADKAGDFLPRALQEYGFSLKTPVVYRLKPAAVSAARFKDLTEPLPDTIIFASSENARNFFKAAGKYGFFDKLKTVPLIGMGLPTQRTVSEYGFSCIIPESFTFSSLACTLIKELKQ